MLNAHKLSRSIVLYIANVFILGYFMISEELAQIVHAFIARTAA